MCWETVVISLPKWSSNEQKDEQVYIVPYLTDGIWILQDEDSSQCDMRSIISGNMPGNSV